jgi:hypothetical protein
VASTCKFSYCFINGLLEYGEAYCFVSILKNSATSRNSYVNFCEFTIQCLHTSASHLNDRDQRLPADRPYTNGYFLDLVSQVRRYAAMVRAQRERVQETSGSNSNKEDMPTLYVLPSFTDVNLN